MVNVAYGLTDFNILTLLYMTISIKNTDTINKIV